AARATAARKTTAKNQLDPLFRFAMASVPTGAVARRAVSPINTIRRSVGIVGPDGSSDKALLGLNRSRPRRLCRASIHYAVAVSE
ncbi:MAG: hypothetical protein KAX78_02450, partial [Phycisphaerae bacterium]|nr:hypothetical protein [Phycisphaerae bacterium]